jgi:hypothetical protein
MRTSADFTSTDRDRSIFRADAVQRYMQSQKNAELPHLVAPRAFLCLWILVGLLSLAGGFVGWLIQAGTLAGAH